MDWVMTAVVVAVRVSATLLVMAVQQNSWRSAAERVRPGSVWEPAPEPVAVEEVAVESSGCTAVAEGVQQTAKWLVVGAERLLRALRYSAAASHTQFALAVSTNYGSHHPLTTSDLLHR